MARALHDDRYLYNGAVLDQNVPPVNQLRSDLASLRIDRDRSHERDPERRGRALRVVLLVVVLVGLVVGAVAAWPRVEAEIFKTEVKVTTVDEVTPSQAATQLSASGYVEADRLSKVGPKVVGRVLRVAVREGELVRAGQVLVELDPTDQQSAVAAARARVLAAQARVAAARASRVEIQVQAQRARLLVQREVGPRAQLEDLEARQGSLEAQVSAAEAEVRAARADLDVLQVGLDHLTVVAPIDGTILDDPVEVGEMVGPLAVVATIGDLTSIQVEIDVPEGRIGLVRPGGPCEISLDAFPNQRFRGLVHEIGRQVNRAKATIPVKVRFADPVQGILPDMSARVSFLTQELREEALRAPPKRVVPPSAVVRRGGQTVVFVIEDGKVRAEPVRLGARVDDAVEILEGPDAGTRIVDRPPDTLATGQKIKEQGD